MKIYLFWCVKRAGILVAAWVLLVMPTLGIAQEERPSGRELLAQQIRVDRPDLKMEGEIVLRTLKPLTGELRLQKARGEPRQIFAGIMRLVPGVGNVLDGLFDQVEIHDLDLDGLVITITREGYTFSLARATIPEGEWVQVVGQLDQKKNWQVESGGLHLADIPVHHHQPLPPLPLSFKSLQATGDHQEHFSVAIDKIRAGHLAVVADPTGFWGNVLRAMGFAKGVKSSPILFDRFTATVVADAQQVVTQSLLLQAPHATASGRAVMPWQPEPRSVHLAVDVTAKNQPVGHFTTVMPLIVVSRP
ncbi:MAG: hypothetical protein HQL87_17505 [Magnetococcales bacterium]|nr:hypothetical protein [Magnetococcales bacterium]